MVIIFNSFGEYIEFCIFSVIKNVGILWCWSLSKKRNKPSIKAANASEGVSCEPLLRDGKSFLVPCE